MGHAIPMARTALAGARVTTLDGNMVAVLCGGEGRDEWRDPWDGNVVLPEAVWLEPMGFDERPDSGDYSYDPRLEEDAALRVGVAQCLDQLCDFIETRTVRGRTRRAA